MAMNIKRPVFCDETGVEDDDYNLDIPCYVNVEKPGRSEVWMSLGRVTGCGAYTFTLEGDPPPLLSIDSRYLRDDPAQKLIKKAFCLDREINCMVTDRCPDCQSGRTETKFFNAFVQLYLFPNRQCSDGNCLFVSIIRPSGLITTVINTQRELLSNDQPY